MARWRAGIDAMAALSCATSSARMHGGCSPSQAGSITMGEGLRPGLRPSLISYRMWAWIQRHAYVLNLARVGSNVPAARTSPMQPAPNASSHRPGSGLAYFMISPTRPRLAAASSCWSAVRGGNRFAADIARPPVP